MWLNLSKFAWTVVVIVAIVCAHCSGFDQPKTSSPTLQPSSCSFVSDTDYATSRGSSRSNVASKEDCCQLCESAAASNATDCVVSVFDPSDNTCYLKGGFVSSHAKPGVIACTPQLGEYNCSAAVSAGGANCAAQLAATHWNPCYFINNQVPSLIDGAIQVAGMGSRTIKIAAFEPRSNYPFNSPQWPADDNTSAFTTLLSIVQHEYYTHLFNMDSLDTFILVAYSTVGARRGE